VSFKIVNSFPFPGADMGEDLLSSVDASFSTTMCRTEDEIIENARDADAILGAATFQPFNRKVFAALSKCRIIASSGIGFDQADLEAATEYGIVVTNTPDYCLDEVSGRAIALMFALGHRLFQLNRVVREKKVTLILDRMALMNVVYPIFRMRDQTMGVVGFGKIGTVTAMKARGLGMSVIAYDPYVSNSIIASRGAKPVDFKTLLKESDFISVHTPLTEETRNMFSDDEFKVMKPTCYFINTARGGCVDQVAMVRALEGKIIAGAGIDVTADEPMDPDNPLFRMDNVILTGHSAGYSTTSEPELFRTPMTQALRALKGEWPFYPVNPEVQGKWLKKWGGKEVSGGRSAESIG
jgi:D-3-phosphoglycerate dehydrogenase